MRRRAVGVPLDTDLVMTFAEAVLGMPGKYINIRKSADGSLVAAIDANSVRITENGAQVTVDPPASTRWHWRSVSSPRACTYVDGVSTLTEWLYGTPARTRVCVPAVKQV